MVYHIIRANILRIAVYFSEPRGGEEKYELQQWAKCPLVLYAKPSNKRFIIPLQKKYVILQLASTFFVRVFRSILIPSVRMTLTMSKMFARIIKLCQTIEWEVNSVLLQKQCYFGFYFLVRVFKYSCSLCIHRYSPCRKPVELVFCAFSWPYMVKWHNSGIIKTYLILDSVFAMPRIIKVSVNVISRSRIILTF